MDNTKSDQETFELHNENEIPEEKKMEWYILTQKSYINLHVQQPCCDFYFQDHD